VLPVLPDPGVTGESRENSLDKKGCPELSYEHTLGGYGMRDEEYKKTILMRLRRIEGQLRGLQRMVEGDTSCSEILTQVAAVTSATKKVGMAMVQGYMEECMAKAGKESAGATRESFKEFPTALSRYIDWA
jgi:CsoR family transcriptional regulator, copper-sensing transcriptional repressor